MMLDKRLINLCSESKKYVKLTVLMNWISMICNASVIILLGKFINCVYKEDKGKFNKIYTFSNFYFDYKIYM